MVSVLEGVKVIDFSCDTAGAYAAMLLAEQGADCIRVEPKTGGTSTPSPAFALFNRSKRNIALNLELPENRDALQRLLTKADIFITDLDTAQKERLQLSYEALAKVSPRLIYCSITPFGEKGPRAGEAASLDLVCAFAGTFGAQGGFGQPPVYVFLPFPAYAAAFLISYGASLALLNREQTGRGQKVETSLLAGAVAMESSAFISSPTIQPVTVMRSVQQGVVPAYRLYEAQDGKWFIIACGNPTFWNKLCMALDRVDLLSDPRFEGMPWALADVNNRLALTDIFTGMFAQKPRAHWLKLFEDNDVPCAPVNTREEFMDDPQVQHNHMMVEIEDRYFGKMRQMGIPLTLTDNPPLIKSPAPVPGEHTAAVLKEIGYQSRQISALKRKGVI